MRKFLRDNGFALTLACLCLLLSAWLYSTDLLSPSSVVQLTADGSGAHPLPDIYTSLGGPRPPSEIAQDNSLRLNPRAKTPAPRSSVAGLPEIPDSDLSPAEYKAPAPQHR
jgi:hypothetical protein